MIGAAAAAAQGADMNDPSIKAMNAWVGEHLPNVAKAAPSPLPFSFAVGKTPSAAFIAGCKFTSETKPLDKVRTQHTLTWKDAPTGLEVRCIAMQYSDYPTIEWTLWFKNAGRQDSPPISTIRALDVKFTRPQGKGFVVHTLHGSLAKRNDFEPRTIELEPSSTTNFSTEGGRATSGGWPYWNIELGRRGVIAVLAWPGQWDAAFVRDETIGLTVTGGLGQFNSVLKPGEEVRGPLALLQFREGGAWLDAQNTWRHFYVDHVIPRVDGQVPKAFTSTCVDDSFPNMLSTAAATMKIMDVYAAHGHKFDYWWTDAGWYDTDKGWYEGAGSWTPDPKRWPKGLKEATDHAHKLGMKYVVWFEPERVAPGSWLDKNRPQWLLGKEGGMRLLNLGNDEARTWWTDYIDKFLTEQGIDVYRQDFNIEPLGLWHGADAPGRAGMTEMKYVMGLLSWHDELRRRRPGLLIDTCASGGRRLDLETLRRAVPLLRTDYRFEANGCQQQTYGISQWITYNGTGGPPTPSWMARTHMHACFGYGIDTAKADQATWDLMKRMDAEWREIVDNFIYGDFFPLTDASLADDVWMAWQFHQGPKQVGVVQAFRHPAAPAKITLHLRGLDPAATYELKDFDKGTSKAAGKELMEQGLTIELKGQPDSATIAYKKING
jgi:alpha-galactosidase